MDKTAFNLKENVAGALCYSLGPLSGFIMYFFEVRKGTRNTVVLFHALQSIVVLGAVALFRVVLASLPFTSLILIIFDLASNILWAYLIYQAFSKGIFKVPIVGEICLKRVVRNK